MVGYKLMRSAEFGKTDWAGLASNFGYNNQYNFEANISTPDIQIVEAAFLRKLVGDAMYEDMIAVRNSLDSDYRKPSAIVPMFPNNANYEAFWVAFGLSLVTFAMFSQKMAYNLAQSTNLGDVEFNGQGFETADKTNQSGRKNAAKTDTLSLLRIAEDYLCKNKANFPLLRADICGEISCCGLGETTEKVQRGKLKDFGIYL
jgi:hypothetical protein